MTLFQWKKEDLVHALADKRGQCENLKETIKTLELIINKLDRDTTDASKYMYKTLGEARLKDEGYDLLSKERENNGQTI